MSRPTRKSLNQQLRFLVVQVQEQAEEIQRLTKLAYESVPKRIQYRKGMRLGPNIVYVGRPSRWGNPFRVGQFTGYDNIDAVHDFEKWLKRDLGIRSAENVYGKPPTRQAIRKHLRGKHLACWCKPTEICHADTLLRIANT